jgi:hypothetical protein
LLGLTNAGGLCSTGNVSFLSQNPELLLKNMHPVLLKHLQTNHISIGEDLKVLSGRHWEILSALTGVRRSQEAAVNVGDTCFSTHLSLKSCRRSWSMRAFV